MAKEKNFNKKLKSLKKQQKKFADNPIISLNISNKIKTLEGIENAKTTNRKQRRF